MNKLKERIKKYKSLWREPTFRWLQQFNWLRASEKLANSLFRFSLELFVVLFTSLFFFFTKKELLFDESLSLTEPQISELNLGVSQISSFIVVVLLFLFTVWYFQKNRSDENANQRFVNKSYVDKSLYVEEKLKNRGTGYYSIKFLKSVLFIFLFSLIINVKPVTNQSAETFVNKFDDLAFVLVCFIFVFLFLKLLLELLIYLKMKKLAKDLKMEGFLYVLTTERNFQKLGNKIESLFPLPNKWLDYITLERIDYQKSINAHLPFSEVNPSLIVMQYKIPFTLLHVRYEVQVVEFDNEIEFANYEAERLEGNGEVQKDFIVEKILK
ncbi:hypothetical protein RAK27_18345 [Carnobacterium maltaromaticum]|uniref:Uncharacterized protein n=1 Tax=Carnobacterium maltaromaticum TaxID=2751 RepID=A0AAW9K8V0_CARML|nr:hypothetical protein [Carnobacterium maltaromaticum]MDZ5760604.1 hypothetical protein [Carnobacterium maltaromaticum]